MDKKISDIASGAPPQADDQFVAARAGANITLKWSDLLSVLYPVGSIYANASDNTNPGTLFGFGTWASIGAGRVMVAIDAGDPDFDTAGETGGAKTSVSTGNVSAPTFTGTTNVATTAVTAGTPAGTVSKPTLTMDSYTPAGTLNVPVFTGSVANTTGVSAGTPAGTNSAPAFTGDTVNTSAVSAGTPAGTNSAPTFTGNALAAHSHELPMIVASNTVVRLLAQSVFGSGTTRAPASNFNTLATSLVNGNVALSQGVTAGTPAGTVNAPTFTGNALTTHNHNAAVTGNVAAPTFTGNALAAHNHNVVALGNVSAPVLTGTANTLTGNVSQPTFTGNALSTHNHAVTPSGTVSAPTYTGDAQSVVQPYVVCYLWKRTA